MNEAGLAGVVSRTAETIARVHASAACYGLPENVGVLPVVMTELKLREVERQVFGGDVVIRADGTRFKSAQKLSRGSPCEPPHARTRPAHGPRSHACSP